MAKKKRKTRMDKEVEYNEKKLGMSKWKAHKEAWKKLHPKSSLNRWNHYVTIGGGGYACKAMP